MCFEQPRKRPAQELSKLTTGFLPPRLHCCSRSYGAVWQAKGMSVPRASEEDRVGESPCALGFRVRASRHLHGIGKALRPAPALQLTQIQTVKREEAGQRPGLQKVSFQDLVYQGTSCSHTTGFSRSGQNPGIISACPASIKVSSLPFMLLPKSVHRALPVPSCTA